MATFALALITFWHSLGGPPGEVLNELVSKYNASHPEEQVELVFKSQNYAQAAYETLELLPNERPNLVLAPEFMTGRLKAASALVTPVSSLLDEEVLSEIAELVRKTFGEYSLPMNPSCGVLFMNQNALDAVEKQAPISIEALIAISREMMAKGIVKHGFTCAWPESYLIETVLAQRDLPLVVPNNGAEGYGSYHLSQLADHLLFLWELAREGVFLFPESSRYDEARIPFVREEVAFFMQGSGHFPLISKEASFRVGCSGLPTLSLGQKEKFAFPLGGAAVWVFNAQPQSEVRDFLNYLASQPFQLEWHQRTAYVPVRSSLPDLLEEFFQTHPVHKAVVDQTLRAPVGVHSFGIKMPNYDQARRELYPLLSEIFQFEGSREEALSLIEQRLKEFDLRWGLAL